MNTAWNDYRGKILVEGAQCQEDMGEWRYSWLLLYADNIHNRN